MLLGLLSCPDARRLALLGMGGGSLARAFRAAGRGGRIVGVECRAAVIEVACDWFGLPDDSRFEASCTQSDDFLRSVELRHDLILSDLYLADGMYPGQAADSFLKLCRDRLSDQSVLVINQWASEFQANRAAFNALSEVFDEQVLHLQVQGGNIVAFAFRGQLPDWRRDGFFAAAQSLGRRLDIPLQRHARNLWWQNAQILGVGRFRNGCRR